MIKPGYQTTEFWLTILNTLLMVLVGFGLLQQEMADEWLALATPFVGALIPIVVYIWGRVQVKKAAG